MRKKIITHLLISLCLLLFCYDLTYSRPGRTDKKETVMFGIGGLYNFQTESFGLDTRLLINLNNSFTLVPKFSYYLPVSNINEYFIGLDLNYYIFKGRFQPYLLVGGAFNRWINNDNYLFGIDKKNNFVFEAGGGIIFNIGCRIKPYVEYRYSFKWKEGVIGAGLIFSFGECYRSRGFGDCPAYRR